MKKILTTKSFWVVFCLMIALWILTTLTTWNAPLSDGSRLYGFPLPFYYWGGLCENGLCESPIMGVFLAADLFLLFLIPFVVSFLVTKRTQR